MFVAFEIDDVERTHRAGWSVLVTGTMHRIVPDAAEFDARFDPEPWVTEGRDRWLVVQPTQITGRRLGGGNESWAFPAAAYL